MYNVLRLPIKLLNIWNMVTGDRCDDTNGIIVRR